MSDNPLEDTPERITHIRETAYHLWEADGGPHGRDQEYWERARELVGMRESAGAGTLPNPALHDGGTPGAGIVEEAAIQENLGEFPDRMADQGDWRQTPMSRDEMHKSQQGETQPGRGDAP